MDRDLYLCLPCETPLLPGETPLLPGLARPRALSPSPCRLLPGLQPKLLSAGGTSGAWQLVPPTPPSPPAAAAAAAAGRVMCCSRGLLLGGVLPCLVTAAAGQGECTSDCGLVAASTCPPLRLLLLLLLLLLFPPLVLPVPRPLCSCLLLLLLLLLLSRLVFSLWMFSLLQAMLLP